MEPILAHDETHGRDPAVLLLHAFPFDRRLYRRQVATLAREGVRAVAVDLRGFGGSSGLSPTRAIDDHADDVARLLDRLAIARAIVVGVSMGGYVSLAIARRHPSRIAGLLLSDTRAGADSAEAREGRAVTVGLARGDGPGAVFDAMRPKVLPSDAAPEVFAELRGIAAAQTVDGVVAALEMMRDRPDATADLGAIAVPTRVVVGSEDATTPPSEAEILARGIHGAQLSVIQGAGHFPNVERPEAFDAVLLDLVAAVHRAG